MRIVFCIFVLLLSLGSRAGDVRVEYITPKIVRVQWSPDGLLPGNNTGVCIYDRQKVKSEEIIVKNVGGCL